MSQKALNVFKECEIEVKELSKGIKMLPKKELSFKSVFEEKENNESMEKQEQKRSVERKLV